jgi:hypothetical protein
LRNAEWKKRSKNSEFRIRNSEFGTPDGPASKLRIVECGMRIEKGKQKNPKSEITGPMLFAQKILASGPRLKHPGNIKLYESQADPGSVSE